MVRPPHAALRPFIHLLWVADHAHREHMPVFKEQALPDGRMHLVIRLSDSPIRIIDAAHPAGRNYGFSVIGGARSTFYTREVSGPSRAIGATLLPGATQALFRIDALEFAERHTGLSEVWGAQADALRDELLAIREPKSQLDFFEAYLLARIPQVKGIHPAIAQSLADVNSVEDVRSLVLRSGISHRRFIELFGGAVGLTPKRYARVQRLRRVLKEQSKNPARSWTELALDAGYSDQPHFNREFREFAGMTPDDYRRATPESPGHVLLDVDRPARRK